MLCRRTSIVRLAGGPDMRVTYDPAADALYIYVSDGEVAADA